MYQTVAYCACQSSSGVCQNADKSAKGKRTSCVGYKASYTRETACGATWTTFFVGQVASYIGQRASCISQ